MIDREHIHPVSETLGALKTDVRYLRERAGWNE